MKSSDGASTGEPAVASRGRAVVRPLAWLLLAAWLLGAGCVLPSSRRPALPGRTTLDSPLVILPTRAIGNFLLIEVKWDRFGPYHFLVDTGSSMTLVTPALARRYPGRTVPPAAMTPVRGANGRIIELPRGSLRRLELGAAKFEDIDVLLYDCAPLSAHLGVRIDGILGFPLFREVLLTLDYPGSRVILQPVREVPLVPGSVVPFDDARKSPLISVRLGERTIAALIDSGSDAPFSLNPVGLTPDFVSGPTIGATVGTISGDRTQTIGRLAGTIAIGGYEFHQPIVEVTDTLSAIGGGMLRHFSVTFDQQRDRVTFYRDSREPIPTPPRRSAGVSFNKTPAYWRVDGVVPGSSAASAGLQPGDLVVRINGESVAKWDLLRYDQLVATTGEITLTLLNGNNESERTVKVFELVP
jgi:hypothetical protein